MKNNYTQNGQKGPPPFKWDPNNIKIKSLTVEKTLEPLVTQVTSLVNNTGPCDKRKGQSKSAAVLVATMERATEIFIQKGNEILAENPSMTNELQAAIDDVRQSGEQMSGASRRFAEDPCSSAKRADMVKAARPLLLAVTRLLIVADMIDVQRLLDFIKLVQQDIESLRNASSQQEVVESHEKFCHNTDRLFHEVDMRQRELKDERSKFELAAARAVLKKNRTLLLTASKVYIRHPEISEAKKNRDFAFSQVCEAVNTISDVASDKEKSTQTDFGASTSIEEELKSVGKLVAALDEFDRLISIEPINYADDVMRPALEASLERIITASAAMADFECPLKDKCRICREKRYDRQDLFVVECNTIRQALQDLLSEYIACAGSTEPSEGLCRALEHMYLKSRDLRHHLRQAAVDHVAYALYVNSAPVDLLVSAATSKDGDEKSVEEMAQVFRKYTKMYFDVAYLNCCMSSSDVGPERVDRVAQVMVQLEKLCPEVVNAALIRKRTASKVAEDNLDEFRARWLDRVEDLMYALDRIIVINDLLMSSESHIDKDRVEAATALHESDRVKFEEFATAIVARCCRLHKTIEEEMALYERCAYTESVLQALAVFKKSNDGCKKVKNSILRTFNETQRAEFNQGEFDRVSNELLLNLKQVRYAARLADDLDSETEADYEENTYETRSKSSAHTDVDEFPGVAGISNTRDAYRFISDEDKQKIAVYVENFKTEKNKFDQEVAKWDDNGNDIIAMAKKMCKIMMDMTDFTRGRGPLKTTMDVINAAQKISEYGTELDKIALLIADQSPESQTKQDLMSYLKEIALYCHQLNITSKVKADVQNISGNLIVSGLDSATSLIQAAKNLMNAVVSTVKASYVASTMYNQRQNGQSAPQQTIVKWNVKAPEKKPLVRKEKSGDAWARVHRAPRKRNVAPLRALNQFS